MAKKKGKKSNNTALFVILAIIAIIVIVAIIVIFVVNPGGIKDKIMNVINGQKSNTNTNSGGSQNQSTLAHGEGELQFHMLNVGQGDWLLILLPDGKEMLIDSGNVSGSQSKYADYKTYMDTYITDGTIDYVMLTHSDKDHVTYMDEIFRDYTVLNLYMPALYSTNSAITEETVPSSKLKILDDSGVDKTKAHINSGEYANFFIKAFEENCNIYLNLELDTDNDPTTLDSHSKITSSDNTYSITFFFENLDFYNSVDFETSNSSKSSHMKNGVSPTTIIEYNGKRIVLTGDSNQDNEPYMVQRMKDYYGGVIDCDVLKVAHHGSHEGSSNAYLDEITCEYAMISCNTSGNTFNHPRQATLDRLHNHNITLYRTDLHGTIVCKIDKDGNITVTPTNTNVSDEALWKGADAE
ncbi:MAG: hypothetical protein J5656_00755 [Clostridia bacterium]|nr:hypothetical protein [Clostridia bacterium]